MKLTDIVLKSKDLNEIRGINSIPDISDPPSYLQLFFNKRFMGYYNQEGIQINNPLFKIVHNLTYQKIKKLIKK
ncbi:MAG: hypothetical protein ISS82_04395 [Nanoarchaeota archaeon]|nr:hypothetical protein [Nanoarchaeota archaeon]